MGVIWTLMCRLLHLDKRADENPICPARERQRFNSSALASAGLPSVASGAFVVALAVLIALMAGSTDRVIAGGDYFPLTQLNPARCLPSALSIWNTSVVGTGDLQYGSALFIAS